MESDQDRTPSMDPGISGRSAVLVLAASLLGLALHLSDGLYSPWGIGLIATSFVLCVVGVLMPQRMLGRVSPRSSRVVLVGLVLVQIIPMAMRPAGAGQEVVPPTSRSPFDGVVALAAVAAIVIGVAPRRVAMAGFILLLAAHASIGIWKIRSAPEPFIDVFVFQHDSAHALAKGENPYTMTFPHIYNDVRWYGEGIVRDGRLQFGFPYPPLVLLLTAPTELTFGDFRYAQLLSMVAAAAMIAAICPGRTGLLIAAIFLFTPRVFLILDMSWTEPLSVMLLAATVLCALRWPRLAPVALGLLIASKQYLPAALVLVPLLARRETVRFAAIAIGVALLVTLPLALWDIKGFWQSVVTLQLHQPYRRDSLSFLAWWGLHDRQWVGPFWLAFAAMAAAMVMSLWREQRGVHGFAAAFALCFFAFFAFNKQAFANYYYLVLAALCIAAAAGSEKCTSESIHADNAVIGPCAHSSRQSSPASSSV